MLIPSLSVVNRCGTGVSKGLVKFKILAPLANEPTSLNEPVLLASSPNPFHENCTITYGLPKPSDVKLILYDNQGKEKVVLVDEKKASGWHTQNLTSKSLMVGSYILRLEVNGQGLLSKDYVGSRITKNLGDLGRNGERKNGGKFIRIFHSPFLQSPIPRVSLKVLKSRLFNSISAPPPAKSSNTFDVA